MTTVGADAAAVPPRATASDEGEPPVVGEPTAAAVEVERGAAPSVEHAPHARPRSPARASEPTPASTLADEAELLRRAAGRLDAAELDEAARLLDAHAQRHAQGELADERRRLLAELARRRSGDAHGPGSR